MSDTLVALENLNVSFPARGDGLRKKKVHAVSDVSLTIKKGESFGLVGESGCGKSTLGNSILGLVNPTSGKIQFEDKELTTLTPKELKAARQNMQMIFQDPFSSLNPRFDVFQIISEPLLIRGGYSKEGMQKRVLELLDLVGLPQNSLHRFPSDFSGGQRQRIGIARAIALNPQFLVCDEPVSALDVSVHAQILNLLMDLQKELGITYLFISHNLAVVKDFCSSIAVMYLGSIVEVGDTKTIFNNPKHPYTKSLLSAVLDVDADENAERIILQGDVPSPVEVPSGCSFYSRCPMAKTHCSHRTPELTEVGENHKSACFYAQEVANLR